MDGESTARPALLRSVDVLALRALARLPQFESEELLNAYDDFSEDESEDGESPAQTVRSALFGFWLFATVVILTPFAFLGSVGLLPVPLAVAPALVGGLTAAAGLIHGVIEAVNRRRGDGTRGFVPADSDTLFVALAVAVGALWLGIFTS